MRDSIFYASIRSLFVAFCAVIGFILGLFVISLLLGVFSSSGSTDSRLTTVNTEEILPNADGTRQVLAKTAPVILQLDIKGIIGGESLDSKIIRRQLVESREGDFKNSRVKGILLYINTPGGTVTDADDIYRALLEYKHKYEVPIYAYVDGLCASGGVYVAMAADKIFASETSLIGSVGVLSPSFPNFSKLLDKIGVDTLTLTAGKGKDALNPLRPWKPGEEDNYRHIIDFYYNHFVDLVVKHRPEIEREKLIQDYGAHIFPAPLALEHGFIDKSDASLQDALKALIEQAALEEDNYQVIRLEDKGWWKSIFSNQAGWISGRVEHHLSLSPEIDALLQNRFLYLYCPQ